MRQKNSYGCMAPAKIKEKVSSAKKIKPGSRFLEVTMTCSVPTCAQNPHRDVRLLISTNYYAIFHRNLMRYLFNSAQHMHEKRTKTPSMMAAKKAQSILATSNCILGLK